MQIGKSLIQRLQGSTELFQIDQHIESLFELSIFFEILNKAILQLLRNRVGGRFCGVSGNSLAIVVA